MERLENIIDERQIAREKATEDRICGLLLERELLKVQMLMLEREQDDDQIY